MCIFHLTNEHDGDSCPKMVWYKQMEANKETIMEIPRNEDNFGGPRDFVSYYLEYESDLE